MKFLNGLVWLVAVGLLLLLTGCLSPGRPLIAERSPVNTPAPGVAGDPPRRSYVVRKGDTLYSIAWRFELDYQSLARANGIRAPYNIVPNQSLSLVTQLAPGERVRATGAPSTANDPAKIGNSKRKPKPTPKAAQAEAISAMTREWVWPLTRAPHAEFGRSNKGLDYRLGDNADARDRVRAANGGEVVYAGNGIGGYERLIIVKHSANLLSAYSFDGRLRVAENQSIKAGAELADIRNRGRNKQSLHFELRKDGQPINPRQFLR
jgi:lipoprotein NlpD